MKAAIRSPQLSTLQDLKGVAAVSIGDLFREPAAFGVKSLQRAGSEPG